MRRFLLVLGAKASLAMGSCERAPAADVGLSMTAPAGLLDEATSVTLSVFPAGGEECRSDGTVSDISAEAQKFQLGKSGCPDGVTWCGEITLERGDEEQMFFAEVKGGGTVLGQGCTTAVIDQDPVEVNIKVVRFVPPSCCGDGALQPGELCDTGPQGGACGTITADAVCEADCSTRHIPVDFEATSVGAIGQTGLSLTYAPGNDELDGALRAVWQTSATDNSDVGLRYLRSDLSPVTTAGLGEVHVLRLPCTGNDAPLNRAQRLPSVTQNGSNVLVAFVSNYTRPLVYEIHAMELPPTGCSNATAPILVGDIAASVSATEVDVAGGPNGVALVVWEQNGQILGRSFPAGVASQMAYDMTTSIFTIAPSGRTPRVAGNASGWVVVYQGSDAGDDDGVFARRVSASLTPGAARAVNTQAGGTQDQPDVWMLADGRYAVAWRSAGDIFSQRFGADDTPVSGDQDAPLNTSTNGDQAAPAVGGTGEFFAVVWENGADLRARFLGAGGGFLFNNVSGQNDDFPVTRDAAVPKRPAVTAGPFVIFGWEDLGVATPGMFVRRFPVPR